MIVHYLNPMDSIFLPNEADAELVVNSDAVPSLTISLKGLQPVPWRAS
jgi:hypothetical protein